MSERLHNKSYLFLTGSVFMVSVQVLMTAVLFCNQIPLTSGLYDKVVVEWMFMVSPERELIYFRGFVIAAVAAQAVTLRYFECRFAEERFYRTLRSFFLFEAVITVALLGFAFGIAYYGETLILRQPLFYATVVLAVVHKFFFREFRGYLERPLSFLFGGKHRS